ncbi:MAG: PIN domain-containing protein [Candidatus Solibacter sp.]|jgi:predicted nucleic acid-binding protein
MKRILFDTNIVLDVLLDRQPYVQASAAAWAAVETGVSEGMLAAHAVTTIHYLVRKEMGSGKARRIVAAILRVFAVAAVDGAVVQEALQLPFSDFEGAVTAAAARLAGCECIVTRDPKGFRGSPVRSLTPEAVMPLLGRK